MSGGYGSAQQRMVFTGWSSIKETQTDPGGILIELLPLRIRDHMPDRYCRALQ